MTVTLRSIWTALRIVWDFQHNTIFKWISIVLGAGLPALFLAIEMPITGVAYRLGNVCIPNSNKAFQTWFAWLLVFGTLGSLIQVATILFCVWKYALSALLGGRGGGPTTTNMSVTSTHTGTGTGTSETTPAKVNTKSPVSARRRTRVEWRRVQKVLALQWRSMLLAFILVNETIYFGIVFVQQTGAAEALSHGSLSSEDLAWSECLITTGGNKAACLPLSNGLGLSEPRVIATLLLASVSF